MFTFLHAADLHLDSPLRGLSRHEDAPVEAIRNATRRALENLVDLALEKEVTFILIAGDLYDGDQGDYNTALFFNRQMARLGEIPVYLISGNHDAASVITKALSPPGNVTVFSVKMPESKEVLDHPVTVHGQGFANASVQENLALAYPEATPDHFNIGLLHTSLAGNNPQHDTYAPCSLADLSSKGYHYWALGHIHQPAVLQKEPWVVYPGNIQGRKINEPGPRGCYLVEVDDSLQISSHQFITLDVVRWLHLSLALSEVTTGESLRDLISSSLSEALRENEDRLLAIRLTLTGATSLHGNLHSNLSRWQAECTSISSEIDPGLLWFERLKLCTSPTYDPAELAQRDDLTALVLESLDQFNPEETPPAVAALDKKLPPEALAELAKNPVTQKEIAAIVLHRIATSTAE